MSEFIKPNVGKDGIHTARVKEETNEIAKKMQAYAMDEGEIAVEDLEREQGGLLEKIIKKYDLAAYLKFFLYTADSDLQKLGAFEEISENEKAFKGSLQNYMKLPENSDYYSSNVSQDVSRFLGNKTGRERMITLALLTHMPIATLNHILCVKLGGTKLNARNAEEAILQYVLGREAEYMGYNGYRRLLEKKDAYIKKNPADILAILGREEWKGQAHLTQFVEKNLDFGVNGEVFLRALFAQPLTHYAELLRKELTSAEVSPAWTKALEDIYPDFLRDFPQAEKKKDVQKKAKLDRNQGIKGYGYIRRHFGGYGVLSRSALEEYEALRERIESITSVNKMEKGSPWKEMNHTNADGYMQLTPKDTLSDAEKILRRDVQNAFNDAYKKAYTMFGDVKDLPEWCREALLAPLNPKREQLLREGSTAVVSNDLVFMKLWLADLQMKIKAHEQKAPLTEAERRECWEIFQDETNALLLACGMEALTPVIPFQFLVLLSFVSESPLEQFANMIYVLDEEF